MKTVWIVVISAVAAAIVVGGGTYYLVNAKATKDKDALQTQITDLNKKVTDTEKTLADVQAASSTTPTASPSSSTTTTAPSPVASVSTAGWKTFTNKTYGFSFKYPAADVVNGNTSEDSDSNVYVRNSDEYWLYHITVTSNTANKTLAQVADSQFTTLAASITNYAKEEAATTPSFPKTDLTIGGVAAKKMVTQPSIGYSPSAEVVLVRNNNIITISPRADSDEFNTILSTFQFTN